MKIQIIGCGNAFFNKNYNQSFLLTEEYKGQTRNLLIDFGSQIPAALANANINPADIDDVYISHLHSDHIGGLECFAFQRYDWINRPVHFSERTKPAPRLIANCFLMRDLWDKSLKGGLESMEGFQGSLETYFETVPVAPNGALMWQGWELKLIQQVHIMDGSVISPAYGLFAARTGQPNIYFTTDSQHCSPKQIEIFYIKADVIFQDCECTGVNTKNRTMLFSSGVHANYAQLAGFESVNSVKLSDEIKSKMWLSHYQEFVSNNVDFFGNQVDWQNYAKADGFKGFVEVGQVMDTKDL